MGLRFPIYLDYHASTPVDPRALEAMLPYFTEHFGNAASRTHAYGWKADDAVEAARRQVASLIEAGAVFGAGGQRGALVPRGTAVPAGVTDRETVMCRDSG